MERLSKYVSWREATHSNTAIKNGIDNIPNKKQKKAMIKVATKVFDVVREHFGKPIAVNSFFRSQALNKKVGGAVNKDGTGKSQHCRGQAVDMDGKGKISNRDIMDCIVENTDFDQAIGEFPDKNGEFAWVHVSYKSPDKNRGLAITSYKNKDNETKYLNYV